MDDSEWLAGHFERHRPPRQALLGAALPAARLHPALLNGAPGGVIALRGQPFAVMSFVVADGKIAEIDTIADPERVPRIAAAVLAK